MTEFPAYIRRFAQTIIEYVRGGGSVAAVIDEDSGDVTIAIDDPQLIDALVEAGEEEDPDPPAPTDTP